MSAVKYLTITDVANILQISKTKAYQIARSENFPAYKIGKQLRVPSTDLENWVKSMTNPYSEGSKINF